MANSGPDHALRSVSKIATALKFTVCCPRSMAKRRVPAETSTVFELTTVITGGLGRVTPSARR